MMRWLRLRVSTLLALGIISLWRAAGYRLGCRFGLYRLRLPVGRWHGNDDLFAPVEHYRAPTPVLNSLASTLEKAEAALQGDLVYYSHTLQQVGSPPDWFLDPFSKERIKADTHWSLVNEFSGGDIKNVWEASRCEWVPLFACAWRFTQDDRYLLTLNRWMQDWLEKNPLNSGPNWKCGQEAAIRLINLLLGARLLGCHLSPSRSLVRCVAMHCQRIVPTLGYAIAQNNNHGTSEAAALYIGGGWLKSVVSESRLRKAATVWQMSGRRLLEERILSLVAADGSFSQYSTNYHRVLLDTLSQVEIWRRELHDVPFPACFVSRCRAAVAWLFALIDSECGDAPNLGANDGAYLYQLSTVPYRDFRPSVQLAGALYCNESAYGGNGNWNDLLHWFGIAVPTQVALPPQSRQFDDGGYAILRRKGCFALLRYPRFRFRPSHADALQVDLWRNGENLLRDAGTYSYNAVGNWTSYFNGTESHNTVQFDLRDQMPRLGRFLFGNWLKTDQVGPLLDNTGETSVAAAYTDSYGSYHHRTLILRDDRLIVRDTVSGFRERAVLRWHLLPTDWGVEGGTVTDGSDLVQITATVPLARIELCSGWESRYYLQKCPVPVLEAEIREPGTFTTEYRWQA